MVTEYGMSDRLGLVTYERERRPMFLPQSFSAGKTYSEARAGQIDEEISRVIGEAHERVRGILSQRREVLDDLAHLLLEKEVVQGDELRGMLSKSKPLIAASLPKRPSLPPKLDDPQNWGNRKVPVGFIA
jgi:cell division protease FtsH